VHQSERETCCVKYYFLFYLFLFVFRGGGKKISNLLCEDVFVTFDLSKKKTFFSTKISKEIFLYLLCEDIFVASLTDQLLDFLHRCVWLHHLVEGKKKKTMCGGC
jgi:hypothetical protein